MYFEGLRDIAIVTWMVTKRGSRDHCWISRHRALPIGLTAAQVQIDLAEDKLAKRKVGALAVIITYIRANYFIGRIIIGCSKKFNICDNY